MRIFHFNDEERDLHAYLAERGHSNVILAAERDPFERVGAETFDAAFVGLHPHGLQIMRALHRMNADCLVTIITADRNARIAVESMKLGAFDYLMTPLDFADVERTVIMMTREHEGQQERSGLEGRLKRANPANRVDGGDGGYPPPHGTMKEILEQVERDVIAQSLDEHEGNISRAAAQLQISRTTLYHKLRTDREKGPRR